MKIEFRRTGERRYAVVVYRRDRSVLEMNPAPGYDPLLPHDMLHYAVEHELGLRTGIFGQLAGGGDAGTFHEVPGERGGREATRRRRRLARRGAKLLRDGRSDSARSEEAAAASHRAWLSRRKGAPLPPGGDEVVPEGALERIHARLDALSATWTRLGVGESMVVDWPDEP
jgi:hypothetical protein